MDRLMQSERDGGGGRRRRSGGVGHQRQEAQPAGLLAHQSAKCERERRGEAGIRGVQACATTELLISRL